MLDNQKFFLVKNIKKRIKKTILFQSKKNTELLNNIESFYLNESDIMELMESVAKRNGFKINFNDCFICYCSINDMYYYELSSMEGLKYYYGEIYNESIETAQEDSIILSFLEDYIITNAPVETVIKIYYDLNIKETIVKF
jgi:hypothetical protein